MSFDMKWTHAKSLYPLAAVAAIPGFAAKALRNAATRLSIVEHELASRP
jgi:hypothetical protein